MEASLISAAENGHWALFFGFCLMILVSVVRASFKDSIPSKYVVYLTQGMAVTTAIAASLTMGQAWYSAIIAGVVVGTTANGMWSLIGKTLLGRRVSNKSPEDSSGLEGKS